MTAHVVVVGGGQAGFQACISLRKEGYQGEISLVCGESHLPYMRPPLSKAFLKSPAETPVAFRDARFYADNGVAVHLSRSASNLDPAAKQLALDDGQRLNYSHLILATGAKARLLEGLSPEARNVHYLRDLDDSRRIRDHIGSAENIGIIGGGYIGLEFASTAIGLGKCVTVFETGSRLLERSMIPMMSDWFFDLHRSRGVDVRLNAKITRIHLDSGAVTGVELGAESVPVDMLLIGIGATPNTALAEQAGLETKNGIVVNGQLLTSAENVYSIGDCASFPHYSTEERIRLESVQNAVDQAKFVARHICCGNNERFRALPWFWTEQYDFKVMIAGLAAKHDRYEVRMGEENCFNVDVFYENRLTSVFSVNDTKAHLYARKVLNSNQL